jgi:hypothetical protein
MHVASARRGDATLIVCARSGASSFGRVPIYKYL